VGSRHASSQTICVIVMVSDAAVVVVRSLQVAKCVVYLADLLQSRQRAERTSTCSSFTVSVSCTSTPHYPTTEGTRRRFTPSVFVFHYFRDARYMGAQISIETSQLKYWNGSREYYQGLFYFKL